MDTNIFSLFIFNCEVSVEKRSFLIHINSVFYSLIVAQIVNQVDYIIFVIWTAMLLPTARA